MNLTEFDETYSQLRFNDRISIHCDDCNNPKEVLKHKAKENIKKNGRYSCQKCRTLQTNGDREYTDEGRTRMGKAASYKRSDETKQKMSESRKAFYETPEGQENKKKLSKLTAQGHVQNKYENAKRQGWFPSVKTGELMFYGSSYELRLCWQLDQDDKVLTFETQIGYEIEGRGRCLDCLVAYKDGTKKVIEVKPEQRLCEEKVIAQIADNKAYAESQGWGFEVCTEKDLGMTYDQMRDWADEYRTNITGTDFVAHRKEAFRKKANKHYREKIATDKVEVYCDYCKETHTPLRLTYDKNMARNDGKYICERAGGAIAGKKPKKKKVNPYDEYGCKMCLGKCGLLKFKDEFGIDNSRSDGRASACKVCRTEAATAKYHAGKVLEATTVDKV